MNQGSTLVCLGFRDLGWPFDLWSPLNNVRTEGPSEAHIWENEKCSSQRPTQRLNLR